MYATPADERTDGLRKGFNAQTGKSGYHFLINHFKVGENAVLAAGTRLLDSSRQNMVQTEAYQEINILEVLPYDKNPARPGVIGFENDEGELCYAMLSWNLLKDNGKKKNLHFVETSGH